MKTNDIRHSIKTTSADGNDLFINIRLNDECDNGHQDFAIGGDIYKKGKPKVDRYFLCGGCIHDEILKVRPDLKIFVDLHLCDYKGIPMYAIANGHYHMFGSGNMSREKYCEYYRITEDQYNQLRTAESEIRFALLLRSTGILEQWEEQAKEGIKKLEEMTGKTFKVDSRRTNLRWPSDEEIEKEQRRESQGYYKPENIKRRKKEAEKKKFQDLMKRIKQDRDKAIHKAQRKFDVYKEIALAGGEKAIESCIYYDHSDTVKFNWSDTNPKLSNDEIDEIIEKVNLPEGVEIHKPGRE